METRARRRLLRRSSSRPRLECLEPRQLLATFQVTTTLDDGAGSLRQAIIDANSLSGPDSIVFDLPGSGVRTLAPASPLPEVTDPAAIDASTISGYAGTPLVELNGANAGNDAGGFVLRAGASIVRGFAINRFRGSAIEAIGDGNTITANVIGTNVAGTQALGNGRGIVLNSRGNLVGGTATADRNLISGNTGYGLTLGGTGGLPSSNRVQGNFIGTNVQGTGDLGNGGGGILINSSDNLVGGATTATGNIIAFNGGSGVQVGEFNFQTGIVNNAILTNSIFSNVGLGIDLGSQGVTTGISGFGPNNLQPFPTITSAFPSSGGTRVEGRFQGVAGTPVTVQFFGNTVADPSGFGQGRTFLGSTVVTTDASGSASIAITLPTALAPGQFVTATATDPSGNTSEFSSARPVTATASADLSVSGFANPDPVQSGEVVEFIVTLSNFGPSQATGVILEDILPAGSTFVSARSTQGTVSFANGVATASIGILNSGQSATLTVAVRPTVQGRAVNTATARADQPDPNPQNSTATQEATVVAAFPIDLYISGQSTPNPGVVGAELTYLFVVGSNSFRNTATGVTLIDPLPAGLEFVSARSSQGSVSFANGTVTAALGSLTPFANATVVIVVRPTLAGAVSNTARVEANEPDPNALNNEVTVETVITSAPPADLSIVITAAPQPADVGQPFTYAWIVSNNGPVQATGVVVSGELPDAASFESISSSQGTATVIDGAVTAKLGNLPAGASALVTIRLRPGAPGSIESRASVTANEPDFFVANNFSSLSTQVVGPQGAPYLVAQKLVTSRKAITGIVLTFSEEMDPILASDPANYKIIDLGKNAAAKASSGQEITIATAVYDRVTRSVTLTPQAGLRLGRFYRVLANAPGGPGLTDLSRTVLDGDRNGLADGIYSSLIGRGTHERPIQLQVGASKPAQPRAQGKVPRPSAVKTRPRTPRNKNVTVIVNNG